jgi:hypothetical protein
VEFKFKAGILRSQNHKNERVFIMTLEEIDNLTLEEIDNLWFARDRRIENYRNSNNQELLTFQDDLVDSLKLGYADFSSTLNRECNKGLFEMYRGYIQGIFKTLKRFGIDCENA